MKNRTAVSMLSLALLLTGSLATSRIMLAADAPESKEVSKLLVEAKTQAMQLKQDAETMESFTRSDVGWTSHVCVSDQVREDVNLMVRQITKIQAAQETAAPWQKALVERVRPVVSELVANTNDVIGDLNKTQNCLNDPKYKNYIKKNCELAEKLASILSDSLKK